MSYSRAPISEAVLEIRTQDFSSDMEALRELGRLTPEFPEVREITQEQLQFQFGNGVPEPVAKGTKILRGFQFWSENRTRVWQATSNGFSFSHLKPYGGWEKFEEEARSLWALFRGKTGAVPSRLAVRYINRFDIPLDGRIDFSDYFAMVPNIPKKLDTGLAGFLMQLVLPQKDLRAMAVVNQAPTNSGDPKIASIILDVDLYRDVEVPTDEEEVWEILRTFRDRKNLIFEESILDPARELIK